jgi:ribonuclease BN (tRNA processing enzyme)
MHSDHFSPQTAVLLGLWYRNFQSPYLQNATPPQSKNKMPAESVCVATTNGEPIDGTHVGFGTYECRQLKIKTSTLRRLTKELGIYENEMLKEQNSYDKLKHQNAELHDLKYAVSHVLAR